MVDAATRFAIAFAERVSPDEVDAAPALLERAREGGAAWRKAVARDGGAVPGGVGGLIAHIGSLYQSGALHDHFETLKFCVEVAVVGVHVNELRPWIKEYLVARAASAGSGAEPKPSGLLDDYAARLEAKGLTKSDAQQSAEAVRELLRKDPEGGADFLEALSNTS